MTKSTALKIAEDLDDFNSSLDRKASAELRRLDIANKELVEVLIRLHTVALMNIDPNSNRAVMNAANAAIAKHGGQHD